MRRLLLTLAMVVLPTVTSVLDAQDLDLHMTCASAVGVSGVVEIPITFDNTGSDLVAGWSIGMCHDVSVVEIVSAGPGSTALTVFAGGLPDFESTEIFVGQGYTSGVVIDFLGSSPLPPGFGYELSIATYQLVGTPGAVSPLTFCTDIGVFPPTATILSLQGGISASPLMHEGQIEILPPTFRYLFDPVTVQYDAAGAAAFEVCARIQEDSGNPGYPNGALAFSMAVAHDPALLNLTGALEAGVVAALDGGMGADFFGVSLLANGVTVGAVFSFEMDLPLQFMAAEPVMCISYETLPGALAGDLDGVETLLSFQPLGSPVVQNLVLVGLTEFFTLGLDGEVSLLPDFLEVFVRGDANGDGVSDISDPVYNLNYLFTMGPSVCLDAQDSNDDGVLDISDPVYSLEFLFAMGPALPAPVGSCGTDPTPDLTGCDGEPTCN